jgi:hypothetical protein
LLLRVGGGSSPHIFARAGRRRVTAVSRQPPVAALATPREKNRSIGEERDHEDPIGRLPGVNDKTIISLLEKPPAEPGTIDPGPSLSSVAEFVADAIAELRRNDGLSHLLAGIAADGREPTEADREWAREALGVS